MKLKEKEQKKAERKQKVQAHADHVLQAYKNLEQAQTENNAAHKSLTEAHKRVERTEGKVQTALDDLGKLIHGEFAWAAR